MVSDLYWQDYIDRDDLANYDEDDTSSLPVRGRKRARSVYDDDSSSSEYVNMQLPDGESVRFKRTWGKYRFTDDEVEMLKAGMEIRINTPTTKGIIGSLDWQEYNGYEYYGFAPWDAEAYSLENAPFPVQWNNHMFTDEEEQILRSGKKLLLVRPSNRTGSLYPVNVSFGLIKGDNGNSRWGIIPHFEEFNQPAMNFTRETCVFMPMFGGKLLSHADIMALREGRSIRFEGTSKNGRNYTCLLSLILDHNQNRWRLEPRFS